MPPFRVGFRGPSPARPESARGAASILQTGIAVEMVLGSGVGILRDCGGPSSESDGERIAPLLRRFGGSQPSFDERIQYRKSMCDHYITCFYLVPLGHGSGDPTCALAAGQ